MKCKQIVWIVLMLLSVLNASDNVSGIHPWLGAKERVVADLFLDGTKTATIDHTGTFERKAAAYLHIQPHAKELRLRGKLIDENGETIPFDKTWKLYDIAAFTAPLYDTKRPLIERMKAFYERAGSSFPRKSKDEDVETPLKALEKERHIKLPKAFFELAHYDISIDNNYFKSAKYVGDVVEFFRESGYTPDSKYALEKMVSSEVFERYRRSFVIAVEIGDGVGALAWDSKENNWFWTHEDMINEPETLLHQDGTPKSNEEAVINFYQRFGIYEEGVLRELYGIEDFDAFEGTRLIIDTAHPNAWIQLGFHTVESKGLFSSEHLEPYLWFRSYGYRFSMY